MEKSVNLDKVRTATVMGDKIRRSSLELIDKMAHIGGQAAAVARMTEDDFDLESSGSDDDEEEVVLKSEMHDMRGSPPVSCDEDVADKRSNIDERLGGPRCDQEEMLAYVNKEGRLCIHPGAKYSLCAGGDHSSSRNISTGARHILALLASVNATKSNDSHVTSVLSALCGDGKKTPLSNCGGRGEHDNAVASLRGIWVSPFLLDEIDDVGKTNDALVLYINVSQNLSSIHDSVIESAVRKLQRVATLLSRGVAWVSPCMSDSDQAELMSLAKSCGQCLRYVQQQIKSFRVSGAFFLHYVFNQPEDDGPTNGITRLRELLHTESDGYFDCVDAFPLTDSIETINETNHSISSNSDDKRNGTREVAENDLVAPADASRLKSLLFNKFSEKLTKCAKKSESSENQECAEKKDVAAAMTELLHLCVMAVELLETCKEAIVSLPDEEEINSCSNEFDNGESMGNSRDGANETGASTQCPDVDSKESCSLILSSILLEHGILLEGTFEERKLTEHMLGDDGILEFEKLSEIMQAYFSKARGPEVHNVMKRFLELYRMPHDGEVSSVKTSSSDQLSSSPPQSSREQASSNNNAAVLALQKCQKLNKELMSRIEKLSTENSALESALEEKTDKALDAWAVAQEKYTALEEITHGMHEKMASQEDLIVKLKQRVHELEKLNRAMKEGVLRMIQEEEGEDAKGVNFNTGGDSDSGGGGISDYLSFALACATGYEEPRHINNSTSGIHWNPSDVPHSQKNSAISKKA